MNAQTKDCDRQRIDVFLSSDDVGLEDEQFIAHLESCDACCEYMESRAADPGSWSNAAELLQPAEFDQASSAEYSVATIGSHRIDRPVAIQRVLDSLTPSEHPHRLGRLGTYEVSGVVGAGGMGVVLKAMDPSLDRVVAIKVLAPHLANDDTARKRFSREAKAVAAVLHPNVIPIHSVSSDATIPYLVMAYIRGGSLQKRLNCEGPLPTLEVLRIGAQIAAGLAAAHEQGLVHRDIKPENILLEEGVERVALTDFGLARAVDDASVTREGTIAGTPQYMSPEQARGESVDHQSDLFSLGSVLYALCTGRLPFQAESSLGVMRKIIDESPTPIAELNPEIPEWLCSIIDRLMAKERGDRFESAADLKRLMETCLGHLQQPTAIPLPIGALSLCKKEQRTKYRFPISFKSYALGGILVTVSTIVILLCLAAWLPNDEPSDGQSTKPLTKRENALVEMLKGASEDTEYASGYSEQKFQAIEIGDSIESVEERIGKPLNTVADKPYTAWLYAPDKHPGFAVNGEYPSIDRACNVITFDKDGRFSRAHGQGGGKTKKVGDDALLVLGELSFERIIPGPLGLSNELVAKLKQTKATTEDIRKRFGEPQAKHVSRVTKWLVYSRSPSSTHYRKRMIGIDQKGRVCEKKSEFYWD